MQSLQMIPASTNRVGLPDRSGIMRQYPVNDPTFQYVRHLVESGGLPDPASASQNIPPRLQAGSVPAFGQGYQHQPSLGSLPLASLQYSSASSFGQQ